MEKQVLLLILSLGVMCTCSEKETSEKGTGYLTLNISQGTSLKSDVEITDFTLRINDGHADAVKERIADLPAEIVLPVGTYTIEAYSLEFSDPKFEMPFYSGKTTVDIEAGETTEASLVCSQGNAGVKVVWAGEFSTKYSTYQAQINCDAGYLNYSSTESRTGYFLPGTVSISILADGQTINGGTITLAAKDMVTVTLRPKETPSGNLSIDLSVDETVNSREVEVIVDPEYTGANSETNPYTIAQAIARQGENGVWITGYIVGSKPSSGYDYVNSDTWQATNIVLADDITETGDTNCIFVELGSGTYRNSLNLKDHADNLHRQIVIKGNLAAYQSRSGLKNPAAFSFK
ncbi:MAG: DUF4493 domain-containing protein [Bacteroidales bacterium]|jgi:hypothetical protein|nr:DUF4493 domain-containing protein [Bacteroidales bacterium]